MEKQLFKINKIILLSFILFFVTFTLSSQTPSPARHIRLSVWASLDAYPGVEHDKDYEGLEYPVKCIKEVAPYIINGMVYGWEFYYVPYDKTRGVEEYLEVNEIVPVEYISSNIKYSSPWFQDGRLNCWCDFYKDESQIREYYRWSSINNPVISGKGYGNLIEGFNGIKAAADDALKNAIRSYYRSVIKNKPKSIRGKVLIKNSPIIGIDAGRYVFNLDFFLECGKITEYKVF